MTWFDSDLSSGILGALADGNHGFGYALSLEAGRRIALGENLSLTPQAQLVYSNVRFDDFTGPSGEDVSIEGGDSLRGRLGLALERQASWTGEDGQVQRAVFYGIGNLHYDFLGGTKVNVSGTTLVSGNDRLWGEIGLGGTYNWGNDNYSLYGEVTASSSLKHFGDSHVLGGRLGFRLQW